MTWTTALLTNSAYGYPRGAKRRMEPFLLACLHITGNSPPVATAIEERNFANRAGSEGPSAHDYLDRDGGGVHAIDPTRYAAWSNGVLNRPNTAIPGIAAVVDAKAKGVNPNECYVREIECCGYPSGYPITSEQLDTAALLIAQDSIRTDIEISRATVHTHADLDSVNRANCAFPAAEREARMADLIGRAQAARVLLMDFETLLAELRKAYEAEKTRADAASEALQVAVADLEKANAKILAARKALDG